MLPQLVGDSCGTSNPISSLLTQLTGSQRQNPTGFKGPIGPSPFEGKASAPEVLHSVGPSTFKEEPSFGSFMTPPPMSGVVAPPPAEAFMPPPLPTFTTQPPPLSELRGFETGPTLHRPPTMTGPTEQWSSEFVSRESSRTSLPASRMTGPVSRPMPMGGMSMGMPFMGMPMGGMMGMPMMSQFSPLYQDPYSVLSTSSTSVSLETSASVTTSTTSTTSTTTEPVALEGGGGLNQEMIDRLAKSDNPKWRGSKFLKFLQRVQSGEIEFKDNQIVYKKPEELVETTKETPKEEVIETGTERTESEWEAALREDSSSSDFMKKQLEQAQAKMKELGYNWTSSEGGMMDEYGMGGGMMPYRGDMGESYGDSYSDYLRQMEKEVPKDPEYQFEKENRYYTPTTTGTTITTTTTTTGTKDGKTKLDPFTEGVRQLQMGNLKKAILLLEAAVQYTPDNAEAWRYLGQARAENEDESNAIAAFLKALAIDPYNLPALMMLGVSYTNDLEEARALKYLKTWILHHPDYQDSVKAEKLEEYEKFYGSTGHSLDHNLHDEVVKLYLSAIEINPKDHELHTVLGVLYHLTNDFDKAIAEFKEAVRLNPKDPTLWNKLGATQANSNRSPEAVDAYRKALEIRPTYVRALANLAISYANQNKHQDAAIAYLSTLKQNPNAAHVWSYLRLSLSHLNKPELVELCAKKDVELFRKYFKF